jgi:hypothetical protein
MSNLEQHQQKISSLITAYQQSKLTQKTFCHQNQIPLSTFQLWLKKFRQHNSKDQIQLNSDKPFIPITVQRSNEYLGNFPGCVIEYPNGVIIRFSGPIDISLLAQLVYLQGQ